MNTPHTFPLCTLWLLLVSFVGPTVSADVSLTFGNNVNENKEVSDLVTKNAKATAAINAFAAGDLRQCEQLLNEAYKDSKDLPKVDVMMGRLLIQSGRLPEAMSRLENYLRAGEPDPEAHASLGEIALRTGRLSDAWLQFREAMTLVANSNMGQARKDEFMARLTQLKAEAAEARNDIPTAEKLYQELEKMVPKSGYPLWAQGRMKVFNQNLDEGYKLLKKARELDANLPQPELTMAQAVVNSSLPDRDKIAEKWFQEGIRQSTVSGANWFEYAKWLLTQDRAEMTQRMIRAADAKYRDIWTMKLLDAIAYRFLGKADEAEAALSKLFDSNPSEPNVTDQLALVLIESSDQGKKLRAQQLAEANLRRTPNDENAIATYGWIQFRLGSVDVAYKVFNELTARGPISPQTTYYVAKVLESLGIEAPAFELYEVGANSPGMYVQRKAVKEMLTERRAKLEAAAKKADPKDKGKSPAKSADPPPASTKKNEPAVPKSTAKSAGEKGPVPSAKDDAKNAPSSDAKSSVPPASKK